VNCGSTKAGLNTDVVLDVAHVIKELARLTADADSIGCGKFVAFCNAVQDNPFVAGAFHGVGEAGAVINVGISGPGVVLRAVQDVGPDADFGVLTDAIKRMAFRITRAGELVGRRCAARLSERSGEPIEFGVVDISLAPTPADRDSIADILVAMGLEDVGLPARRPRWRCSTRPSSAAGSWPRATSAALRRVHAGQRGPGDDRGRREGPPHPGESSRP
jgi:uncharacterized protein